MFKWIKDKLGLNEENKEESELEAEESELEAEETELEAEESEVEVEESELEVEESELEVEESELEVEESELEAEESELEVEESELEVEESELEVEESELEAEESELEAEESEIEVEESELEVEESELEAEESEVEEKKGFFAKLKDGLTKTRDNFTEQINEVLKSFHKVDEELFEELEEILIMSDVGMETTMDLIDELEDRVRTEKVTEPERVIELLKEAIKTKMLDSVEDNRLNIEPSPAVILVVGVNGVGKTTTIGKLSHSLKSDGKKVLVAAADTFRAAAIEQLEEWGNRANVDIISHKEGADPGAVVYDGIQAAKARSADVLICDTAGRLHNKANLMNELNKIFRIVENEYPEATKEVLLVLDATTGQNAMNQAKTFKEVANITGIALTKLDGTAKGGVVIALQSELGVPIKFVGVGEGINDLQPFDPEDFIDALFEN